jgi:iron-sulfur cluster insertion protein
MSSETTSINLSGNAVKRIQDLLPTNKSNYFFRVYVTGGGVLRFSIWFFKFDDCPDGDDDIVDFDGFTILLDSLSYPYLYGSTLDYVEDLSGSRFLVTNPNAKTTCGCGESFTI